VLTLQLFPIPGIYMMMIGGPLIIGMLMHLLMLHLGVAALLGSIGREWLALPFAYYAGGFALYLESGREASSLAAAINKANAAQVVSVQSPFTYLAHGVPALELLKRFRIDGAFIRGSIRGKTEYSSYYYAHGDECEAASKGFYFERRFSSPFRFDPDLFPSYSGADKTRQCILLKSVETADPDFEIKDELDRSIPANVLLRQFIVSWKALDIRSNQVVASVQVGSVVPLPAIQTIIVGCGLNSGRASWDCGTSLMSGSDLVAIGFKKRTDGGNPFVPTGDPDTSNAAALGHALGLAPRLPTD
jgi:hypothetical protein